MIAGTTNERRWRSPLAPPVAGPSVRQIACGELDEALESGDGSDAGGGDTVFATFLVFFFGARCGGEECSSSFAGESSSSRFGRSLALRTALLRADAFDLDSLVALGGFVLRSLVALDGDALFFCLELEARVLFVDFCLGLLGVSAPAVDSLGVVEVVSVSSSDSASAIECVAFCGDGVWDLGLAFAFAVGLGLEVDLFSAEARARDRASGSAEKGRSASLCCAPASTWSNASIVSALVSVSGGGSLFVGDWSSAAAPTPRSLPPGPSPSRRWRLRRRCLLSIDLTFICSSWRSRFARCEISSERSFDS